MKKEEILSSPKIELINSEGPILVTYKANDNRFYIFDQWKSFVAVFDQDLMEDFVLGKESIMDSKGKLWSYNEQPEGMTPSPQELMDFIHKQLV